MLRNFHIEGSIALRTERDRFDLWNDHLLMSIAWTASEGQLDCVFRKVYPSEGADFGALARLAFKGIEFLELHGKTSSEGLSVEEIGFKARHDNDLDWLIQEGQQDGSEDIIIRLFQVGHMRVKAAHAEIAGVGNV